jgi:hypothetical protein
VNRRAFFALVPFLGLATRLKAAIRQPAKLPKRGQTMVSAAMAGQRAFNSMLSARMETMKFSAPLEFHPHAFALVWAPIPIVHISSEEFRKRYPPAVRTHGR